MANLTSLKASHLSSRASTIAKEIIVEETILKQAVENKAADEEVVAINSRISFLKRKQLLFKQAARAKQHKD